MGDIGTPALSWRRLGVLIRQLPRESRTLRAMDPRCEWDVKTHLLAGIFDSVQGANWQRSGSKGPPPAGWPRPDIDSAVPRKGFQLDDLRRILHPEEFADGS